MTRLAQAALLSSAVLLGMASCQGTCCSPGAGAGAGQPTNPRVYPTPPTQPNAASASQIAAARHPRLWLRADDLPRLRSWAREDNPVYARGLAYAANEAKQEMDAGRIPSSGACALGSKYCESYALLFAFMSLVAPEANARDDYAKRARTVLMHMMDRVSKGEPDDTLCQDRFAVHDRSRWAGEAFGLTVDWIHPHLSTEDKETIRSVFLRWAEQQLHAKVTSHNHPEPVGLLNDPKLVTDAITRRYAANNYFTAHMRNLALMAMALDPSDDPPEPDAQRTYPRLGDYLSNATGAWLYMTDHVTTNDARGGTSPEGFEYATRSLAFMTQTYWALETAGEANAQRHGSQVVMTNNPFFAEMLPAFLHTLSPKRAARKSAGFEAYEPAWTGDGERYMLLDFIDVFAPLGILARQRGGQKLYDAIRWIQLHTPVGGKQDLIRRAHARRGELNFRQAILYFLLLDPDANEPADPRPSIPLDHFGPGLGQIFSRTSWDQDARWFTYQLGWAQIDHQHGDGNTFGLYRKGEWLTKERVGYGWHFENSDQHNTLAVENSRPNHHSDERRSSYWKRGSQWVLSHAGDPTLAAHSFHAAYVYALGDATNMYNSEYEGATSVEHVSRSIVWLKPDHVVLYDRARTGPADRFKRLYLHTENRPVVEGNLATATTGGGQKLFVRTLLPSDARIEGFQYREPMRWPTKPAEGEPMMGTLRVEPAKLASDVRFLHVLQGADADASADPASHLRCEKGPCEGAVVRGVALLFPTQWVPLPAVRLNLPAGVTHVMLTGLEPNASYTVSRSGPTVSVDRGGNQRADAGGVLWL